MPQSHQREISEELRSEIGSYISSNCVGFPDNRLGEFLSFSVGRILLKEAHLGRDWRAAATTDQIRHITDWLKSSIINDDAWLSNIDAHGRPEKLLNFASIDEITRESEKAMLKAAQRLSGVKLVEGDEEFYAELEDGYYVVRLLTPAALVRERAQMQHCIGDGVYDEQMMSKYYSYLSLRDAAGTPHATMEIWDYSICLLQGEQNETPEEKYLDRLVPFIKKHRFKVGLPVRVFQHVVDARGDWHHVDDLPEGLTVNGWLDFKGANITKLPDRMTVGGDLHLENTRITDLPKGLSVEGNLSLRGAKISSLPEDLSVKGSIDISKTAITFLPDILKGCTSLFLESSGVTTLPDGMKLRGGLYLRGSNITSLPEGLSVGLDIDLGDTQIASLPERLSVGGNLNIEDTKIASIPDDISVGRDLLLGRTAVTSLPEGLSVGGSLSLYGLKIEKLPDVLSVGADLDIRGTLITTIPAGVSVGQEILSDGPRLELALNKPYG